MHDILIIGSGVIGMSIARQLSQSHLDIAIVDRDVPGMHLSYKAGGMLGAQNEFITNSPLFQLAMASRDLFPDLNEELYDETGIDIEFQQCGLIKMASSTKRCRQFKKQFNFLKSIDSSVIELSDYYLSKLSNGNIEPSELSIFIPNDGQINANHYTKSTITINYSTWYSSLLQNKKYNIFNITMVTTRLRQIKT